MSHLIVQAITKKELYKDFDRQLKRRENRDAVLRAITATCASCRPPNPIICVESCPIWTLKRKHRDAFEALAAQSSPTDLLRLATDERRLNLLEALHERPCTLEELREHLKHAGYSPRLNVLRHRYVTPLADASFIQERAGVYTLTRKGKSIYTLITTNDIAKLSLPSQGSDEKLLKALLAGPQTYEALRDVVPHGALRQSLRRLQKKALLVTPTLTGRVFYYATKKRPTRKLSSTELKVFKALPPEGLSAKDLRDRVGISLRRVYTYLTRLKYKRHVRKETKAAVYRLTEAGQRVAQAITLTSSLIAA